MDRTHRSISVYEAKQVTFDVPVAVNSQQWQAQDAPGRRGTTNHLRRDLEAVAPGAVSDTGTGVDAGEGHNDFLTSNALLTEALVSFTAPPKSRYVRPRTLYKGEGNIRVEVRP